ncbi:MAG: ATP-binding cassette domain-containing protein [Gammaproteobacteria bacterium]|nr:ATP-binding cassette domain-containing protein [Gammaproteobacteria bacterium]
MRMNNPAADPVIRADGLGKIVPSPAGPLAILADVSFTIAPAEAFAIVGVSGSGKSTLLGLLAGLDLPSSGRVQLDGIDLGTLDEDGRARVRAGTVGFVFQSFHLLANLTALENVMLPLELAGRSDARALATEILERAGLGARQAHYPRQLSGGEQQRVAIARAFAPRPRVLLADEPTGNLDRGTAVRIVDLLFALRAELGTTLVLVTHDERLAGRCDRVLVLEAGRIASLDATGAGS